jgi:hypothetical protein
LQANGIAEQTQLAGELALTSGRGVPCHAGHLLSADRRMERRSLSRDRTAEHA